ncbi:MAG TPA: hypothetical protein VJM74_05025 [Nitrososphaeraceae archaeon]|nr:hypothetical protein [Nitrososphaeraceae archaeon]
MTRQNKVRSSHDQRDESPSKKNEIASTSISLDDETELLKRKLEAEKARKRTRGPYRKSSVN